MREIRRVDSILSQLTVEYDDLRDFNRDLSNRKNEGWSAVGKLQDCDGKKIMRYTKLVDIKVI